MKSGLAAASLTAALVTAPAAQAGTLAVDRGCYGPGETVTFSGGGYAPNGSVALSTNGRQVATAATNPGGAFSMQLGAPFVSSGERIDPFTASDRANPANTGTVRVRLTALDVNVRPRSGSPARKRRIRARGFTSGRRLYVHVVRGRSRKNVSLGRLKGACGTLRARKRIFSKRAKTGTYRVQFDARRRYRAATSPRVTFSVTIFRILRPRRSSAAGVGERWTRVR